MSAAVDPDVDAIMRRWGVNEVAAQGMIALEKAGINWATPIFDEGDEAARVPVAATRTSEPSVTAESTAADNPHMSGIGDSDTPVEVDELELAVHMRVWHEDEDVARGMIAIEKLEAEKAATIDADAALEASAKRLYRDLRDP